MSTWNFDRLSAAYAAGWAARLDRCDESVEVLAVELRRDQLGFLLDEPGPMRDMRHGRLEPWRTASTSQTSPAASDLAAATKRRARLGILRG